MKVGVLTVPLYDRTTEEAFAYLSQRGVQTVELGTGGSPGNTHCNPAELLADPAKLENFKGLLAKYNLSIGALSVHSNHVHPNAEIRATAAKEFTLTLQLAQKLGVDTVVTFSGCPGDCDTARYPNWVTCAWPDDYQQILQYQWDDVLIPFWKQAAQEAAGYGVTKIALEMHPGFAVYNPASLLRLREAVGPAIGANFDPSHLYWQGINPPDAIRALKGAIYHFHMKDTQMFPAMCSINGVLDPTSLAKIETRSWLFRTIGYGHGEIEWKEIVSALQAIGYNGSLSIEHEDILMSVEEGLNKAISFLQSIIIHDRPGDAWWV